MLLNDIKEFIECKVPKDLAIPNDFIGFLQDYDLNQNIKKIEIYMDFYPKDDVYKDNTLILTHHKPLFKPKTPTYVLHSNWDIIEGGANDALAESLGLEVLEVFDDELGIGRICTPINKQIFVKNLSKYFSDIRIVGDIKNLDKIAIISGFGLKNPDYIKLAKQKNVDILVSGDLTQETAVLAINNDICLIDVGHHNSEIPGLYRLSHIFDELDIHCIVVNKPIWKTL